MKPIESEIDKAWSENVKIERIDGWASYDCRLGLWGVSGPDGPELLNEAKHYFWQYFEDGEYSEGGAIGKFLNDLGKFHAESLISGKDIQVK